MDWNTALAEAEAEQSGRLISPELLAELRWLATSEFAIPVVEKRTLGILLDAYEAQHGRE